MLSQFLLSLPINWCYIARIGVLRVCIPLFRERLWEKMCTRQSRKVTWDMINNLFLTLQLSNLLLFLSFSNYKHKSMASSAILANFFEEQ